MGASGHPGDVESSASMGDFVDDLACVLEHANVAGKSICIGFVNLFPRVGSCIDADALSYYRHDWGSSICWEAGRARPDIFSGVVSLALPVSTHLSKIVENDSQWNLVPRFCWSLHPR